MDGFEIYRGKKVFVSLKSKRVYTGIINEVIDVGKGLYFITIKDKFKQSVTFSSNEIEVIQEEK